MGGKGTAVGLLQQIQERANAQFLEGAGHSGGAQVQGPLLDVLPGGQDFVGRHLVGDHPGVPRVLAEAANVCVLPGFVLAELRVVGVEFEHQLVCGVAQPPERLRLGQVRKHPIGFGDVFEGQEPGLVLDDLDGHRVDLACRERREGQGQPVGDRARVHDLPGRGLPGQVERPGQLVGGEVTEPGPAAITWLDGRAAAGQFAHGRKLDPRGP